MSDVTTHDDYIAQAPVVFHPLLNHLRAVLAETLPDAEEIIAYKMPGFKIGKPIIAGYAAFSKQCGLYVAPAAIARHVQDIENAELKSTKTGVTFSVKTPIPDALIRDLAQASRQANDV